ncbi:MAG: hypothetical protein RBR69_00415 [Candidatus Cloacimonadaceae bacterium]|jgi:hypothetical protein|nr:hypothetical protein [Candidatus Cloacimonadaceae bacterium]
MEVQFKNLLHAYSGKCDGIVYYYNRRLNKVIARRLPETKPHKQNLALAAISRNLKKLNVSDAYRADLKIYTEMYRLEGGAQAQNTYSWSNVFLKLMFALAKTHEVDLQSLTRDQIYAEMLPCISVKLAVEAGLIAPISGYENLSRLM